MSISSLLRVHSWCSTLTLLPLSGPGGDMLDGSVRRSPLGLRSSCLLSVLLLLAVGLQSVRMATAGMIQRVSGPLQRRIPCFATAASSRMGLKMGVRARTMVMMASPSTELVLAVQAVRKAAIMAKGLQATLKKGASISKSDSSPVTVADFSVQAVVVGAIRDAFPTDQVVAEETSGVLQQDPEALEAVRSVVEKEMGRPMSAKDICSVLDHGTTIRERTWILDPIDGTKGFIRGEHFCVALGMAYDGVPTIGVLGCPNLPFEWSRTQGAGLGKGTIFLAEKGKGTYMLPLHGPASGQALLDEVANAQRVSVSDVASPAQARFCESAEASHSSHDVTGAIAKDLGITSPPVRMDSQVKYGVLSRGQGEVFLRLPRAGYVENIWDHAAGAVVVTEAGGVLTDATGKTLDFAPGCKTGDGKLPAEVTGIAASNGPFHRQLVAAVVAARAKGGSKP